MFVQVTAWYCDRFWSFGLLCCLAKNFHHSRPAPPMPGARGHLFPCHPLATPLQNGRFPSKIALHLKEVCYKVASCEYRQRQRCKAFTGLSIRAKMIGGGHPLKRKFCAKVNHPLARQQHHRFGNPTHALFTLYRNVDNA